MNFEKMNQLLKDPSSVYYCGSSCLLSLIVIFDSMEKTSNQEFKNKFSSFKENVILLFDEDTTLFDISKKKEMLSDEEWKKVMDILNLYNVVISSVIDIMSFCHSDNTENYLSLFRSDYLFLMSLAHDNIKLFSQRSDVPDDFEKLRSENFDLIENKTSSRIPKFKMELKGEEVLLSMLPLLSMLLKLMTRKQNSKKPFSFDFNEKKGFILKCENEFESMISKKEVDKEKASSLLKKLAIIGFEARREVAMKSLKEDFTYLYGKLLDGGKCFDKNRWVA